MDRVRMAVVGMGIGRSHARAIAQNPRTELAALCDVDSARMDAVAAELGLDPRRFTSFQALCADPDIDAIFVGTPNQLHVPVAMAAVEGGKHVLCTKPLADRVAAADELVRAAQAAGVVNMMSLTMRYGPGVQTLGKLSREGELGEIYYSRARSVRRSGIPDWGSHFIRAGGGAFRDMGVHVLDSAWWLCGCPEPVTVLGTAGARFGPRGEGYWEFRSVSPEFAAQYEADDYGTALIRFENGSAMQVESFWASHQPPEVQIELFGTDGGARLEPLTLYRTIAGRPADTAVQPPKGDGCANVIAHFAECILDGARCQSPLRHGLVVQRMLEAVLESASSGSQVRLDC